MDDSVKNDWKWELLDLSIGGKSWSWMDGIGKWVTWVFQSIDGNVKYNGASL